MKNKPPMLALGLGRRRRLLASVQDSSKKKRKAKRAAERKKQLSLRAQFDAIWDRGERVELACPIAWSDPEKRKNQHVHNFVLEAPGPGRTWSVGECAIGECGYLVVFDNKTPSVASQRTRAGILSAQIKARQEGLTPAQRRAVLLEREVAAELVAFARQRGMDLRLRVNDQDESAEAVLERVAAFGAVESLLRREYQIKD